MLQSRLSELRKNMLPATFSPTGDYSARQLDRSRGYRMLVHAEIEAFLEDVTFAAARKGVSEWVQTKKVSDCLFCLMVNYHSGFIIEGFDEAPPIPPEQRGKLKDNSTKRRWFKENEIVIGLAQIKNNEWLLRILISLLGVKRTHNLYSSSSRSVLYNKDCIYNLIIFII